MSCQSTTLFGPQQLERFPFLALWHQHERISIPAKLELIDQTILDLTAHRRRLRQRLRALEAQDPGASGELFPPPTAVVLDLPRL